MKIANSKKLAGCLVNEATCRKKLGKEKANESAKENSRCQTAV